MLDDVFKGIIGKFWHPCKKCLVQAKCNPAPHDKSMTMINIEYDKYNRFVYRKSLVESLGDTIDVYSAIACFIVGIILILLTFIFGCWKWVELIFY